MRATIERHALGVGDGATAVVEIQLPKGRYLTLVSLQYDSVGNSPPVRAFAGLQWRGFHQSLVSGWVRSASIPTHDRDPLWTGRLRIPDGVPDDVILRFAAANNTGAAQQIFVFIVLEDA